MFVARFVIAMVLTTVAAQPSIDHFERLIKAGQYSAAAAELETFTAQHPDSSEAWYQLGYVYFRLHQIGPSVKALSRSLSLNPARADAHRILGHDLLILERVNLAVREFRRAVELDPRSVEAHYALGRAYYENGDYGLATEHLSKTVELQPMHVKAWHNLGLAHESMGSFDRAQACFTKAIELNEAAENRSEWPYLNFAGYRNRQAQPQLALELLTKAEIINPLSDQLHFERAKAFRELRQWEDSVTAARRAIDLNGCNAEYHYVLAHALRKLGRSAHANVALAKFKQLTESNSPASCSGVPRRD